MIKKTIVFSSVFTLAHVITYFIVGSLAYVFITKQFYTGEMPTFTFMRTELEPELWSHTMIWMFPGQILRGILMSLPLLIILDSILSFSKIKLTLFIAFIYFIFSHISATGPTTSNIEGFIYLRPEYITAKAFLFTQPEIIFQALGLGFLFSYFLSIKRFRKIFYEKL